MRRLLFLVEAINRGSTTKQVLGQLEKINIFKGLPIKID
jgi:hypothetical protein